MKENTASWGLLLCVLFVCFAPAYFEWKEEQYLKANEELLHYPDLVLDIEVREYPKCELHYAQKWANKAIASGYEVQFLSSGEGGSGIVISGWGGGHVNPDSIIVICKKKPR